MDDNTLRKVQLIQLEIAKEIKRICEKNNISYFLDSGTLLGAIRHKGFIPWDDDLDIGMYRDDFQKFINIAPSELNKKYEMQTWMNDPNYGNAFIKIRKKGTKYVEKVASSQEINGIYVDVLPYDNFPPKKNDQRAQGLKIEILKRMIYSKSNYKNWNNSKSFLQKVKRRLIYVPIQIVCLFISKKKLIEMFNKVATKYNGIDTDKVYEQTGSTKYGKWIIPKKCIHNLDYVLFEGEKFLAPIDSDLYLSSVYGNYMQLPPENERYNRHSIIEVNFDAKEDY